MIAKTLLITGCSQGIGHALALKFASENYKIYAVSRNQKLLNLLAQTSINITAITADITTPQGREAIAQALKHEDQFSIIHNAGISISSPFQLMSEVLLRQHFETNFFAPLLLTQRLLPQLKGQRVLNISSGASISALENKIPYCTSKGAMHHAIDCLKKEFSALEIYFANLRPGMVDTPMQEKLRNETLPTSDFYVRAKIDGKLIAPKMLADFVAWVMLKTDNNLFTETFWDVHDKIFQSQWQH